MYVCTQKHFIIMANIILNISNYLPFVCADVTNAYISILHRALREKLFKPLKMLLMLVIATLTVHMFIKMRMKSERALKLK